MQDNHPLHTPREPWVDALRALALLGVFVVNMVGYAQTPDYPLPIGSPLPAGSVLAQVLHGLLLALVQGKAWPLLCFLFGYSLCALLRSRYRKLLCVGLLHGSLVYFGDILTAYAVCGLVATGWAGVRPARLLRIWRWLSLLVVVLLLGNGVLLWQWKDGDYPPFSAADTLVATDSLQAFIALNASSYLEGQIGSLTAFFPLLLWLTVAGMLARRFRLLGSRRAARLFWARHFGRSQLALALLLNLALGAASAWLHRAGTPHPITLSAFFVLGALPGIWLVACLLGFGMRHIHSRSQLPRWAGWLAPAGHHTLAMYLLLSLGMALGHGALRQLGGDTALTLAIALLAWLAAVAAARTASRHGWRDPLARWLSRRPDGQPYR
ncbi:uncharacterized protein SAMN05216303_1011406 [Rhodoferax sp. OV413]|uniref:hypothetical protein n=1 Tax=Rhodoferax sp. OV413 TaxID=1855285 RepID=UPI00087EE1F0|nr:hypothetical protein [Rhodoferax sp. OV413]SDO43508.1 uncharacterized protein SAMN05216303_1011406 [Rhodoferax sp. OV413]